MVCDSLSDQFVAFTLARSRIILIKVSLNSVSKVSFDVNMEYRFDEPYDVFEVHIFNQNMFQMKQ